MPKAKLKCKTCGEEKWFNWIDDPETNAGEPDERECFDCKCDFDFDVIDMEWNEPSFPDDVL